MTFQFSTWVETVFDISLELNYFLLSWFFGIWITTNQSSYRIFCKAFCLADYFLLNFWDRLEFHFCPESSLPAMNDELSPQVHKYEQLAGLNYSEVIDALKFAICCFLKEIFHWFVWIFLSSFDCTANQ